MLEIEGVLNKWKEWPCKCSHSKFYLIFSRLSPNKIEKRTNGKKDNGASKCPTRRKGRKAQKRKGARAQGEGIALFHLLVYVCFIQFHTVCKAICICNLWFYNYTILHLHVNIILNTLDWYIKNHIHAQH